MFNFILLKYSIVDIIFSIVIWVLVIILVSILIVWITKKPESDIVPGEEEDEEENWDDWPDEGEDDNFPDLS